MAGTDNLKRLTSEEAREYGSRGGKASVEARRKKKDLRMAFEELLNKEYGSEGGQKLTGTELLALKQFRLAMDGNQKAFELVRDTAGQKPIDRVQIAEVDQQTIDEVERMVLEHDKATSD